MITRINNNRGRRFLNPLEVEAQYHTEDRATDPDLLLWIDFTDQNSLRGANSTGATRPSHLESIYTAINKSWQSEESESAGDKALAKYVIQTVSGKQPTWFDPGDGTPPYAYFNGDHYMEAAGNTLGASVNNSYFSTSSIDMNKFTMYIVCQRHSPSISQRQDVLFVTTNQFATTTPSEYFSFYFDSLNSYSGTLQMYKSSLPHGENYRYTQYSEGDDREFHYHMFNAYEQYGNNDNHSSLQADGLFHQFDSTDTDPGMPNPKYDKIAGPEVTALDGFAGTFTQTFNFNNNINSFHPSITIGGQPQLGGTAAKGTFKGYIYEILIFKNEHAGGNVLDDIFFSSPFKKRWSNMLYYLQRKYQHIGVKI